AGPRYDLAWMVGGVFYVAEVKSLTPDNEEAQLRLGLGQLLRYWYAVEQREKMLGQAPPEVFGVLVVERRPTDANWPALLRDLGLLLIWPEMWRGQALGGLPRRIEAMRRLASGIGGGQAPDVG
ncbi:MAG: hypothetical protein KC620_22605, partial [Myxococcales bacterium]|nr:hypothetical protein [Myxococcales bacterium]